MAFEVRIAGREKVTFETEQAAMEAVKQAMAGDPAVEAEVIDLSTGRAAAPGADAASREALRRSVGF